MPQQRFSGNPARLRSPERLASLPLSQVIQRCLDDLPPHPVVLDIGTGSGLFAEAFWKRGAEVYGIDVDSAMVALATELVPAGRFRQGPAEQLPLGDGSADLAFFGLSLHETDPQRALAEAARVSRHLVAVLEWSPERSGFGPPEEERMRPEQIEQLFSATGLGALRRFDLGAHQLYLSADLAGREATSATNPTSAL
jgi:ubiquinone/menaquinone biosynthesis C-methylase UbiE